VSSSSWSSISSPTRSSPPPMSMAGGTSHLPSRGGRGKGGGGSSREGEVVVGGARGRGGSGRSREGESAMGEARRERRQWEEPGGRDGAALFGEDAIGTNNSRSRSLSGRTQLCNRGTVTLRAE
jgi:hypothetical protein